MREQIEPCLLVMPAPHTDRIGAIDIEPWPEAGEEDSGQWHPTVEESIRSSEVTPEMCDLPDRCRTVPSVPLECRLGGGGYRHDKGGQQQRCDGRRGKSSRVHAEYPPVRGAIGTIGARS